MNNSELTKLVADVNKIIERLDTLHTNQRAFLNANKNVRDKKAYMASLSQFEKDNNVEVKEFQKLRDEIGDLIHKTGERSDELKNVETAYKALQKAYRRMADDSKDMRALFNKMSGGTRRRGRGRRNRTRRN